MGGLSAYTYIINNYGTITGSLVMNAANCVINNYGTINQAPGEIFQMGSSTCSFNNFAGATSNFAGTLNLSLGSFTNNGTLSMPSLVNNGVNLVLNGNTTVGTGGFTANAGTYSIGGNLTVLGGGFTNNSGTALTIGGNLNITGNTVLNNGLTVNGNLNITGDLTNGSAAPIIINGTTTVTGNFSNSVTFTSTGNITVGGNINNGGTLNTGGTTTVAGNLTSNGTYNTGGVITVSGNLTNGGTLNNTTTTGCLKINSGTTTGYGTYNGNTTGMVITPAPVCTICLVNNAIGALTEPTTAASNILFTENAPNVTINFDAPSLLTNVTGYMIVSKVNSAVTAIPIDYSTYTAGSSIGTDNVVGFINSTTAGIKAIVHNTGALACGDEVFYKIYTINGAGNCLNFVVSPALTGSLKHANTYTWSGGASGNYNNPSNWTPNRASQQACDVLKFNIGNTVACNNLNSASPIAGSINITNGTIVQFNPSGGSPTNFNLYGRVGATDVSLFIEAGSTLEVNDNLRFVNMNTGGTYNIAGKLKTENLEGFADAAASTITSTNLPTVNLLVGSTIDFAANSGTQTITTRSNYQNIIISGASSIKTIAGTVKTIGTSNTVTITGGTINVGTNTLGETNTTNFIMTGGILKYSKTNTILPEFTGTYTITNGTIQLYGTTTSTQQLLRGGKTYNNIQVTSIGTNTAVGNCTHTGTLSVLGSFEVGSNAIYALGTTDVISDYGGSSTFFMSAGAAGLYYGNANGITSNPCGTGSSCGAVTTASRAFLPNKIYGFIGNANMVSGNALPSNIDQLYMLKTLASNRVTLSSSTDVTTAINFTNGMLVSSQANLITLIDGASHTNASDNSFVDGPVRKIGIAAFTFPTGEYHYLPSTSGFKQVYSPIEKQISTGATAITDHFTAQYFVDNVNSIYPHSAKEPAIMSASAWEYWILDRTNGTANAKVKLMWHASSGVGPLLSDVVVIKWNGSQWINFNGASQYGTVATTGGVTTLTDVTSFSPFTFGSLGIKPLPVTWLSFNVIPKLNYNLLNWTTATETNNSHFTIEKSIDAINFAPINNLKSKAENGNCSFKTNYSYNDFDTDNGISYYRLKQTDYDGNFDYSEIQSVTRSKNFTIIIFPNPTNDKLFFNTELEIFSMQIINSIGQIVKTYSINDCKNKCVSVSDLSAGIYTIKFNEVVYSKFVKE
jgi:hypothetical protein